MVDISRTDVTMGPMGVSYFMVYKPTFRSLGGPIL